MKKFNKKPDSVVAVLYTGKNKNEINKNFETIEIDGVVKIATSQGHKILKKDQYVYIENGEIFVKNKATFEAKYEEVKTK